MIVMELADRSLWDRYKECRTQGLPGIPRDELLRYMEECAEALDLMNHEFQLQHLDIKPQNLFLVHNHVKVADFGLVKDMEGSQASVTGGITPVYAAPETFDGTVSRFTDQYSLAIVYQELLTGQRPFNGTNVRQLVMQHISAQPNVTPLPPGDQAAVARALAKQPNDRHATCRDLVAMLRARRPHAGRGGRRAGTADDAAAGHAEPARRSRRRSNTRADRLQPGARPRTSAPATTRSRRRGGRPARAGRDARPRLADARAGHRHRPDRPRHAPARPRDDPRRTSRRCRCCRTSASCCSTPTRRSCERRRPAAGASLAPSEVLLAPLNRPSHYLKPRDGRPPLESWLNPKMLYRIPRSQVTTGVRGLGRLAFFDHYRSHRPPPPGRPRRHHSSRRRWPPPPARRGAACGTNRPRVYVLAGLAGGTGGGMFIDLAYTVRALLRQMGYENPDVVGLLLLPSVEAGRSRTLTAGQRLRGAVRAAPLRLAGHRLRGEVPRPRGADRGRRPAVRPDASS